MPKLTIEVEVSEELVNDIPRATLADIVAQEAYEAAYSRVLQGKPND